MNAKADDGVTYAQGPYFHGVILECANGHRERIWGPPREDYEIGVAPGGACARCGAARAPEPIDPKQNGVYDVTVT